MSGVDGRGGRGLPHGVQATKEVLRDFRESSVNSRSSTGSASGVGMDNNPINNSQDAEFSAFIRQRDILQPQVMPLPWFVAADKWARQFEASSGNDFSVNIIQGDGDKTLDWKYNLKMFGHF